VFGPLAFAVEYVQVGEISDDEVAGGRLRLAGCDQFAVFCPQGAPQFSRDRVQARMNVVNFFLSSGLRRLVMRGFAVQARPGI